MTTELRMRWISALVMIPSALFLVWFGGWWLAAGCAIFAAVMVYEWRKMSGQPFSVLFMAWAALSCLSLPLNNTVFTAGSIGSGAIAAMFIGRGQQKERETSGFGFIYVLALAASLYVLREGPWDGLKAALLFMSFVWASDAAAFFGGRSIGGPKLLPSESPNKTWAGSIAGVLATMACGAAASFLFGGSLIAWLFAGAVVSVIAQMGDMLESATKRRFDVKDSSEIIPGHGGLLDRVDGLGAVCFVMSLLLYLVPKFAERLALGPTFV